MAPREVLGQLVSAVQWDSSQASPMGVRTRRSERRESRSRALPGRLNGRWLRLQPRNYQLPAADSRVSTPWPSGAGAGPTEWPVERVQRAGDDFLIVEQLRKPAFKLGRRPVLDGVRAVAILGVLVSHFNLTSHLQPLTRGGVLGVDVFFVLSGFLITSLLIEERAANGRLALGAFYARRALRLFPALFVMVAVTTLAAHLREGIPGTRAVLPFHDFLKEVVPVLTYWDNWFRAFSLGPATALSHAWSLSIEEQFYLVWPLLLLLALRARGYRAALAVALSGAVVSSVLRAAEYHGVSSYDRVYFSTGTRASDLLFGCALGIALAIGLSRPVDRALRLLLVPALATCAVFLTYAGTIYSTSLYEYGLTLFGLATSVVLCGLVLRRIPVLSPLLECAPMVYVGQISYALYLWLRPVEWFVGTHFGPHATMLVGLPLTFALAAASRVFVEKPFLRLKRRYAGAGSGRVPEAPATVPVG